MLRYVGELPLVLLAARRGTFVGGGEMDLGG
jgi:hypothetical protein